MDGAGQKYNTYDRGVILYETERVAEMGGGGKSMRDGREREQKRWEVGGKEQDRWEVGGREQERWEVGKEQE